MYAVAVSDRIGEFGDAAVVLITFTRPRNLPGFRRRLGLAYPVLADEERLSYRAYGLGRGPWWRIWGPRTLQAYRRVAKRGQRLRLPSQDTLQLGGAFVVDHAGVLAYAYRSTGPDDRPLIDDLVTTVQNCE